MEVKHGAIPDGWTSAPLGQLCGRITTGKLDANAMVEDGEYPFFTCARESYRINRYAFDAEALLVSGNGANVGYVHYYKGKFNAYQRTYVLSDFTADVHFLKMFLDRNLQGRIRVEVNAGNTPYITMGTLAEMEVVLPSDAAEQRAIAAALTDVDWLLDGMDRLIAKKRDLKRAAMQQLLTGQTRLPGFHVEWDWVMLQRIVDFANGKPHEGDVNESGEYLLITLDSIGSDGCLKADHKRVSRFDDSLKKNDIVTVLSTVVSNLDQGNILGLSDLVPEDNKYVLNQRMGRLRMKVNGSPRFVCLQMNRNREHFKQRGQGTSQKHIYRRDIDSLVIPFPSPNEQAAIAKVLTDMDAELAALEQRREKARFLKQAMMQELLTGRTRLVRSQEATT